MLLLLLQNKRSLTSASLKLVELRGKVLRPGGQILLPNFYPNSFLIRKEEIVLFQFQLLMRQCPVAYIVHE